MKSLLEKIFCDVDGMPSSKRVVMLWIAIILWSFVHVMVFLLLKPFPAETAGNVIMYDVILILTFGGFAVSEKIWGRSSTDIKKDEQ